MKSCPYCSDQLLVIVYDSSICPICGFKISPRVEFSQKDISHLIKIAKGIGNKELVNYIIKDNTLDYDRRETMIKAIVASEKCEIPFYLEAWQERHLTILNKIRSELSKEELAHIEFKCEQLTLPGNQLQQTQQQTQLGNLIEMVRVHKSSPSEAEKELLRLIEQEKKENDRVAITYFESIGGINLNMSSSMDDFQPAIGRESTMKRICKALVSKKAASVMITGPSGCGKSNLIATIAQSIQNNEIDELLNFTLISLPTGLIKDTSYSGDFEKKLTEIKNHARNSRTILVFDNAETLIGQGTSTLKKTDAAQLLIPLLGESKVIFATTDDQFYYSFSELHSFIRQVEHIKVKEYEDGQMIKLLTNYREYIYKKHAVFFNTNVITDLLEFSDIIKQSVNPARCVNLMKNIAEKFQTKDGTELAANSYHIIKTISDMTGIGFIEDPDYRHTLLTLEHNIKQELFGQDDAVEEVCSHLMMKEFRQNEKARLPSVFFLTGPTGTGKTFFAKTIAKHLLGNEKRMFRVDMAELTDYLKVDKLIGNLYGAKSKTPFASFVDSNPGGILLLDEFEKACRYVQNLFLSVFSEAELTSGDGMKLYFNNMIIIITSNSIIKSQKKAGFNKDHDIHTYQEELTKHIPVELVNRLDAVIFFSPLNKETCKTIVCKMIDETVIDFKNRGAIVMVNDNVIDYLVDNGFSEKFNARELIRTYETTFLKKLVEFYFSKQYIIKEWSVSVQQDLINVTPHRAMYKQSNEDAA